METVFKYLFSLFFLHSTFIKVILFSTMTFECLYYKLFLDVLVNLFFETVNILMNTLPCQLTPCSISSRGTKRLQTITKLANRISNDIGLAVIHA